MKIFRAILAILMVFSLPALAAPEVGRFAAVKGEVTSNGDEVRIGDPIRKGAVIRTADGKTTLLLGKDSVVHLDRDSVFEVKDYGKADGQETASLDLKHGRIRAMVRDIGTKRKSFSFRSRAAVMGVRGTQIYIDSPEDPSQPQVFATLDGQADLTIAERTIQLAEGQRLVSSEGAVSQLTSEQLEALQQEVAEAPKEIVSYEDYWEYEYEYADEWSEWDYWEWYEYASEWYWDPLLDGAAAVLTFPVTKNGGFTCASGCP